MTTTSHWQLLEEFLPEALTAVKSWESQWGDFPSDDTLNIAPDKFSAIFKTFTDRLNENYPFFHPRYAGQMLKPPHPVAVLGYLTAMLINPNNHALDGGPATAKMEKECIDALAHMFGFKPPFIGHLTGGGTMANLEALWVAQQSHPTRAIAFSDQAHYTHQRMCNMLQAQSVCIPSTPRGGMDLQALAEYFRSEATPRIGTVVVTLGTTGLGALDGLREIISLQQAYGFRIHVDAAYGGFYRLLSEADDNFWPFQWTPLVDSIVIDPHKHGLQPYGCGAVIFTDPAVARLYQHDSPYTYFSSNELHLGEISLECSRPGAAAAAFWLTLQCFPLASDYGFGSILKQTRQAALNFAQSIIQSTEFCLYTDPQLDIVTYFPQGNSTSEISEASRKVLQDTMTASADNAIFLATLKVRAEAFHSLHPDITVDSEDVTILRSCLMKPEHHSFVENLVTTLNDSSPKMLKATGSKPL